MFEKTSQFLGDFHTWPTRWHWKPLANSIRITEQLSLKQTANFPLKIKESWTMIFPLRGLAFRPKKTGAFKLLVSGFRVNFLTISSVPLRFSPWLPKKVYSLLALPSVKLTAKAPENVKMHGCNTPGSGSGLSFKAKLLVLGFELIFFSKQRPDIPNQTLKGSVACKVCLSSISP